MRFWASALSFAMCRGMITNGVGSCGPWHWDSWHDLMPDLVADLPKDQARIDSQCPMWFSALIQNWSQTKSNHGQSLAWCHRFARTCPRHHDYTVSSEDAKWLTTRVCSRFPWVGEGTSREHGRRQHPRLKRPLGHQGARVERKIATT